MNTKYIINSTGSTQGLGNPLRNLDGDEFDTREAAIEAVYSALYDVINGENGCEMVERPNMKILDDKDYLAALEKYDTDCHDFIRMHGYAIEDSWRATIEEVAE